MGRLQDSMRHCEKTQGRVAPLRDYVQSEQVFSSQWSEVKMSSEWIRGTGTCISVIPSNTTYLPGLPLDAGPRSDAGGAPASEVAPCAAAPHAAVRGCRREARVHLRAQPVHRYVENKAH
eukprot:scaffold46001_cov36-Phaeocystis_antarctica.AAC.2